jgi:hypothetical protein
LADFLQAELDDGANDEKKIISITVGDGTYDEDPVTSPAADLADGVVSGTVVIVYAETVEVMSNTAFGDLLAKFYDEDLGGEADEITVDEVTSVAKANFAWEVSSDTEVATDAVVESLRTVSYDLTFTSSVDLAGSENIMSYELANQLLDIDTSVVTSLSATTLSKLTTARRHLSAETAAPKTYTYSTTVEIVYASLDDSKLDLGLPKETDKGIGLLQTALEAAAVESDFDVEDDTADEYIELEVTAFSRTTPLIDGSKSARSDLTTSADSEASRTLTVSGEFTSSVKFTSAQTTALEGRISDEMMQLDTGDNILSVSTDVEEQAAAARRLLATYTYDSTSTVITVSATAATDAKTLLVDSLTAESFKTILADAASDAGITGVTFEVTDAPGIVGGDAASSGASAAILGGALGLFAAVAALL